MPKKSKKKYCGKERLKPEVGGLAIKSCKSQIREFADVILLDLPNFRKCDN